MNKIISRKDITLTLSVSLVVLLAGCALPGIGSDNSPEPGDIIIRNEGNTTHQVAIQINGTNDSSIHYNYSLIIGPDEKKTLRNVLREPRQYEVSMRLETGASDDHPRILTWEENGSLTGMSVTARITEDEEVVVNGYTGPGVDNPPREQNKTS